MTENQPITQADWLDDDGRTPHDRLDIFSSLWAQHMVDWQGFVEWRRELDAKMASVLNGILPSTEDADAIVLEMVALEEMQATFSATVFGAESKVINCAGEMAEAKDEMNAIEAGLVLTCTESNASKRKAELTLAQAASEEWNKARARYRNAERDKLIGEAHQKQLERDRSRVAGQVWSRRSRLNLIAARLNAVTLKGEAKT